jgi:large subunit ribosomal protein L22
MSPDSKKRDAEQDAGPATAVATAPEELTKQERKRLRKAAHKRVVDLTAGRASARYVRMTPMKVRRVIDLVRGMDTDQAITLLKFQPQAAALPIRKVVQSAVYGLADKREQAGLDTDREALYIAEAYVDEGPTMKRFRPRAQGRAGRILKRTSHITVVVREKPGRDADAAGRAPRTGAGRRAGRGPADQTVEKKGRTR